MGVGKHITEHDIIMRNIAKNGDSVKKHRQLAARFQEFVYSIDAESSLRRTSVISEYYSGGITTFRVSQTRNTSICSLPAVRSFLLRNVRKFSIDRQPA